MVEHNIQEMSDKEFAEYIARRREETKAINAHIRALQAKRTMPQVYQSKDKKTLEVIRENRVEVYVLKSVDTYSENEGMSKDSEIDMVKGCNYKKVNYDASEDK